MTFLSDRHTIRFGKLLHGRRLTTLFFVAGFSLLLLALLTGVFLTLFKWQEMSHRKDRETWAKEREALLNRSMTKEWQSYAQMMTLQPDQRSQFNEPAVGMSDEEELRRVGAAIAAAQGNGEIIVDFDQDIKDLGLG